MFFYSTLWNLGHFLLFWFAPVLSAASMGNRHNMMERIKGLVKGETE